MAGPTDDLAGVRSAAVSLARYACGDFAGRRVADDVYRLVTEGRHATGAPCPYSSCGDLPGWLLRALGFTGELNRADRRGGWRVGENFTPLLSMAGRITHPQYERWLPGDIALVDLSRKNASGVYLSHVAVIVADNGDEVITADYGQAPSAGRRSTPDMVGARLNRRKRDRRGELGGRLPERVIDLESVPLDGLPDKQLLAEAESWCKENPWNS